MKTLIDWTTERLKERSTWMGIIALLTAFGVMLTPDQIETIVTVGLAVGGAVGVFTKG